MLIAAVAVLLVAGFGLWALVPAVLFFIVLIAATSKLFWSCQIQIEPQSINVASGLPGLKRQLIITPEMTCGFSGEVESQMKDQSFYRVEIWLQELTVDPIETSDNAGTDGDDAEVDFLIHTLTVARDLKSREETQRLIEWLSERTGIAEASPPDRTRSGTISNAKPV